MVVNVFFSICKCNSRYSDRLHKPVIIPTYIMVGFTHHTANRQEKRKHCLNFAKMHDTPKSDIKQYKKDLQQQIVVI